MSVCPYLRPMGDGAVERYAEAGVDQLIVLAFAADLDALARRLDELASGVLEPAMKL